MQIQEARNLRDIIDNKNSKKLPAIFVGHGSPMNAIENNEYSQNWRAIGDDLPPPKAVLVISAHWQTQGTKITAMPKPRTIHDFYGFPKELFDQQYPAPGSPQLAEEIMNSPGDYTILEDHRWGLDHGSWSVLLQMFPRADIPVLQLSLDVNLSPLQHFELAGELDSFREKGVLIIGSGNVVHNLGMAQWGQREPFDWAKEFDEKVKSLIDHRAFRSLIDYPRLGEAARLSVPTNEHYLPMIYILALTHNDEDLVYFNDRLDMGSISMRSFIIH